MSFSLFYEVAEDLIKVEDELGGHIGTKHPTLSAASGHLLHAGGKRLRPAFVLLAGKFGDYSIEKLIPLAVALELIHMASLVHDDVIDEADTRRGIPTVRARWDNRVSIHSGDHLFARSLKLIAKINNPQVSKVLSKTSVDMCQGEIQQIVSSFDSTQRLKDYLYRIKRKTALLISASCHLGSVVSGANEQVTRALKLYGYHLGMAFQVTDDILDLTADEEELGKPVASDLRQGIMTLPILCAIHMSPQGKRIAELAALNAKDEEQVNECVQLIKASGSVELSRKMADLYLNKARIQLELLPSIPTRDSLNAIANFVAERNY